MNQESSVPDPNLPGPTLSSDQALEPPGTIAVIGAGPLGIEAALYGRYLGYNVTLIESESIGNSMREQRDQPLPMMPDRCLSPIALSAINAQNPEAPPLVLPTTFGDWIDRIMVALTETDLLRGRLRCPATVTQVNHLEIEREETDEEGDELPPPDFRLSLSEGDSIDAEAVIVATGSGAELSTGFELPCPYYFRIIAEKSGDPERDLLLGLKQIVDIYATLADRASLDLYRPIRGSEPGSVTQVEDEDSDESDEFVDEADENE